jgi:enoyl-CoA hydratase
VVESSDVAALKAGIVADPADIEEILTELEWDPGHVSLAAHRDEIDRLFAHDTMEDIYAALANEGSEWSAAQLAILQTKSPLSMKTALRQIRAGAAMDDFATYMAMEMRIAARIVVSHDFAEGVRAVIVDKDNAPSWSPASLEGVTEAMLDAVFAPLPADQEWSPLP